MGKLDLDAAKHIAAALITIGHPFNPAAIEATAIDLIKWCRGVCIDGRHMDPDEQAEALVDEVRTTWDKWPDGGTKLLLEHFRSKFCSQESALKVLTYEETLAKGLIVPPCEVCDDRLYIGRAPDLQFCEACIKGRRNARWEGPGGLMRLNQRGSNAGKTPPPVRGFSTLPMITPQQMAHALEDERIRRAQQQLCQQGAD